MHEPIDETGPDGPGGPDDQVDDHRPVRRIAVVDRETGGARTGTTPSAARRTAASGGRGGRSAYRAGGVGTTVPDDPDDGAGGDDGATHADATHADATDDGAAVDGRATPTGGDPDPGDDVRTRVRRRGRAPGRSRGTPGRRSWVALMTVAALGIVGTVGFGHAWMDQNAVSAQQATVRNVSGDFLLALTNFDAKSVDSDFNTIDSYATGDFAKQANQFFGSTIRQQLEAALASSRGQVRSLYVQSLSDGQASVYGVVDQTYVNDKMSSPSADQLDIVTDLTDGSSGWKISDVTVLNDPTTTGAGGTTGTGATSGTAPAG